MRKIIIFLNILLMWFIGVVFCPFDVGFYLSLNIPKIVPNSSFIGIIWIIIYILNSICIYKLLKNYELNNDYYFILILNYIFCESFPLFFFYFHNLFLSLISCIVIFITSIFLILETKKINKNYSYYLYPYTIWSFISLTLFIIIYIIN